MTRLTFNGAEFPLWTPDGKRIVFMSTSQEKRGVYWKAADGTGQEERLCSEQNQIGLIPSSWSRNGKTLLLTEETGRWSVMGGGSGRTQQVAGGVPTPQVGIYALPLEGDHKLNTLLKEKYIQTDPMISPDGRWMAYVSDESGKLEIYVRPFPDVNKGKWQVSTSGGASPQWSADGRELFYRNDDSVMAVAVQTEPTFKLGKTETIFRGTYYPLDWDLSHDGKRFLMIKQPAPTAPASASAAPRKINIVLNWFEELKQRVPGK